MTDVCLAGVVNGLTLVPAIATLTAIGFTAAEVAAGNTVCLWFQVVRLHWAKAQGPLE